MTAQLQAEPGVTTKRLGDGFYEQKLVRDQVLALTGNRFLGNYSSEEQQYKTLMDAGVTYAKAMNLRPGISLTPEQAAQLTSDMVWLVTKEVTLADGSKQSVLVPQVYVRVKPGDLDGNGALLAGADVSLNLSGDATNSGTIAGRNLVQINASNIKNLGGNMSADTLALQASQDIDNIGGNLQAQSAALLSAGRDINLTTTTQSHAGRTGVSTYSQTGIDRVAGLYVSGSAGVLLASAGNNINLTAAQISNAGTGATVLDAGNNLNLNAVRVSESQDTTFGANRYLRTSQSQDVGSDIQAAGLLSLRAGQDINAKAANVSAGQALSVTAGNNIDISAGEQSLSMAQAMQIKRGGFLSSSTTTTRTSSQGTNAIGSSFEGASVNMAAGKDLSIQGSNVLGDQNVTLQAAGNVSITAAQNTSASTSFSQTTKSGLLSGNPLTFLQGNISIGKQSQSLDQQGQGTTAQASTIGSTGGNVSINAGQTYTQTGSDILTPAGNIDIAAKKILIDEARETGSQSTEQKFKQSGLTLAITSPVISALQTAGNQLQAAGNTQSSRMQALAAANAAINVKQAADAIATGQAKEGGNAADKAGGIGINISLGSASSQANSQSSADSARGSTLTAGGNIRIAATGDGQNSNLTVQGSDIKAAGLTALKADGQINLLAAQNTTNESSNQSSKSGSIGVGINLGSKGLEAGVTVSAAVGKGQGAGNGSSYTNKHIEGQSVQIDSGGDTTLKGALVKGEQVTANVGGNLFIQSLQDQNQYKEKSQSAGGSVTIGPAPGGNLNLAQTKINSTYTSVGEQSAIRAGDGGFQVSVQGKTELTGGQITSTQAALDNNKNSYDAKLGTTTTDLQNSASYSATSVSIGLGAGSQPGKSMSAGMSGVGFGSDSGSASSTTTAGISGVAGNTAARTGDASTSLKPIFNKEQVQKEVAAQVAITSEFGKQASKAVGDYAKTQYDKAKAEGDQAGMEAWKEGGANRVALHAVVGGLTGGAAGAVGAGAGSAAAPAIDQLQGQLQGQLQESLQKAGLGESASKVIAGLASGGTAATIGAAASGGSTAGAATAFNADMNNRQLSFAERQKAAQLAQQSGGKFTQKEIEDAMRSSPNKAMGETVATGMTVKAADKNGVYDPGAQFTKGQDSADGSVNLVQQLPNNGKVNPAAADYIKANTGGANSPYEWNDAQLGKAQPAAADPNAGIKMRVDPNWNYMGANSAGIPTGKAKVPDGSYGVGMYTPVLGGEIEVEVQNGEAVGGKLGIGAGVGGHINLGTKKVEAGQLLGPVGGGKSEPLVESNPAAPSTIRIGSSITVGAGVGTVGTEASAVVGIEGDEKSTQTFKNISVGNLTTSPVLPKVQGEIKVNVLEISVKAPERSAK